MDEIQKIWPKWEIVSLIGKGAFGKVYKVKREESENVSYAAVKVIHIPLDGAEIKELQYSGMDSQSIQAYFWDMTNNLYSEIKNLGALKSANNIVNIEDYELIQDKNEIGWDIYIRMELLTDLGSYLEEHGMSAPEVVKLGIDICSALIDCEKENIIHRDIKIDNVFISKFGNYKLGDFGISKQLEKTQSALSQKGTNLYMAPEVFRGERYNRTVDIYSLGILMYRLLNNGRFPFMPAVDQVLRYDDSQKAMEKRLLGAVMDMPACADKNLGKIILKACSFASQDRYQSAVEMKRDLEYYAASELKKSKSTAHITVERKEIDPERDERTVAAFESNEPRSGDASKKIEVEREKIELLDGIKEEKKDEETVAAFRTNTQKDLVTLKKTEAEGRKKELLERIKEENQKSANGMEFDNKEEKYEDEEAGDIDKGGGSTGGNVEEIIETPPVRVISEKPHLETYPFKDFYKYNCPKVIKVGRNISLVLLYIACAICVIEAHRIFYMLISTGVEFDFFDVFEIIFEPSIVLTSTLDIHIKKSKHSSRFLFVYSVLMLLWTKMSGFVYWLLLMASLIACISLYEVYKEYRMCLDDWGYSNGNSELNQFQKSKRRYVLSEGQLRAMAVIVVCVGIGVIFFMVANVSNEKMYDFFYKCMSFLDPDI